MIDRPSVLVIYSAGATATKWLTEVLNQLPDVVCFHALRSNLFTESRAEDLAQDALVSGLYRMAECSLFSKTFAAVHSHSFISDDTNFEEYRGQKLAMFRHPLYRIHSLFTHHFEVSGRQLTNGNVYKSLENLILNEKRVKDGYKKQEDILMNFFRTSVNTLRSDMLNYVKTKESERLVFERMFDSPDYLHQRLTPYLPTESSIALKDQLNRRLKAPTNQHSRKNYKSPDEIFNDWPGPLKTFFLTALNDVGVEHCTMMYRSLGYDISSPLQQYFAA